MGKKKKTTMQAVNIKTVGMAILIWDKVSCNANSVTYVRTFYKVVNHKDTAVINMSGLIIQHIVYMRQKLTKFMEETGSSITHI
jgi:hypothetical protein